MSDRGWAERVPPPEPAAPEPERPGRPVTVELASAMLVVSGVMSVLTSVDVLTRLASRGEAVEPLALLAAAIGVGSILLGVAIRFGRAWLLALNVTAVAAFLELTSGSIVGLVFGGLDLFVVLVLLVDQAWFRWRPRIDDAR